MIIDIFFNKYKMQHNSIISIKKTPFRLAWSVDLSSGGIFGYNDHEVARLCKISGNNDYDFWTSGAGRTDPLLIVGILFLHFFIKKLMYFSKIYVD